MLFWFGSFTFNLFSLGGNLDIRNFHRISLQRELNGKYLSKHNRRPFHHPYIPTSLSEWETRPLWPREFEQDRGPASHNRTMTWRQLYRNRDLNPPNPPEMFHTPSFRAFTQQNLAERVDPKSIVELNKKGS